MQNEKYNGYFSAEKIDQCSATDGVYQEIIGEVGAKYKLGIDPACSSSELADDFAITVVKKLKDGRNIIVHNYAVAGQTWVSNMNYLKYLLNRFDIEEVFTTGMFDEIRKVVPIRIKLINVIFTIDTQKTLNEKLQAEIDFKKIIFAAPLASMSEGHDIFFFRMENERIEPIIERAPFLSLYDFVEGLDIFMGNLKNQLKLVEVSTSPFGEMVFGLPIEFQRSKHRTRLRCDSYHALLSTYYIEPGKDTLGELVELKNKLEEIISKLSN